METIAQKNRTAKGHWPKGRRRNNPRGWPLLLKRLERYIAERASIRKTAAEIGVSDRALRRWLSDEDRPSEESAAQIRELLARIKW